jgi:hypothetical protein
LCSGEVACVEACFFRPKPIFCQRFGDVRAWPSRQVLKYDQASGAVEVAVQEREPLVAVAEALPSIAEV